MTSLEWLEAFTAKLEAAADKAKDPEAKVILMVKWGTANHILERMRDDQLA